MKKTWGSRSCVLLWRHLVSTCVQLLKHVPRITARQPDQDAFADGGCSKKKPLLQMQFTNDNLINRIPEAHEVTKPVAETKSECQHCQVSPGDLSDVGRGVWLADEPFPGLWRASN